MLSLPDFKQKTIVFFQATNDLEHKLKFQNQNVVFEKDGHIETKVSCHRILAIFIVGDFSFTSKLVEKCAKFGVSLFLLKKNFSTYASFSANTEGHVLLRRKQYIYSINFSKEISKNLVSNKIRNQMNLLRYLGIEAIREKSRKDYRREKLNEIKTSENFSQILGFEGSVSRDFFSFYYKELGWKKRSPRTKVDEINYLLDLGYTMIFNYIESICRLFGFDIYKGVYHQEFYQRKSLICDLMEPFRCIIDKTVLKGFRLGQFNKNDFILQRCKYSLPYEKSANYSYVFFKEILVYKEDIYNYIKKYYYFVLNGSGKFPVFIIR
jgi:CRISP-associated protein Cas1